MIFDSNLYLSRWPFRRLPNDETPQLVKKLKQNQISKALAGSFDGLLHKDIRAVNQRLAEECQSSGPGLLIPVGSVNLSLPGWEADVVACHEEFHMPGLRLHPNYHGYQLSDSKVKKLFALAAERDMFIQIAMRMEDDRTQHPLVKVPDVNFEALPELMKQHPAIQVTILNGLKTLRGANITRLTENPNLTIEIAMLEGVGGIEKLIKQVPYQQILFGSYFPFFYLESSLNKLKESDLGMKIEKQITWENAQKRFLK
ncbi:MAG: amidohydrolase [Planctomycetes bacterium]|nr:amidohydrolase [Planctomycetota bacterium]MCH9726910.1 amidohydrolase [Planctomycetota bacterium]MCH9775594.1 amidohydrolase [Planctomycetota bacterium]MCH9790678.1 amidohydrolase [Planctomycetota bacterium]MDF1743310.1 amidohydrolase family protein [Gimesia sp.]